MSSRKVTTLKISATRCYGIRRLTVAEDAQLMLVLSVELLKVIL